MTSSPDAENSGAYILHLRLPRALTITIGRLGECRLKAGHYLYIGSAKRGLKARVARHTRLGESKVGKLHWHIDYLLSQPQIRLTRSELRPGEEECRLSAGYAADPDYSVPIPGFGATDCAQGCPAHLYRREAPRRRD